MTGLRALPLQIVVAVIAGILLGVFWPAGGAAMQWLGTAFVAAIRMVIIPLIFCAVTLGSMKMGDDAPRLGRVALIAFVWFYFASAVALVVGLVLNGLFHPGVGMHLVASADVQARVAAGVDWPKFLLDLIPSNIVAAMAQQKVLPTLIFAVLFGLGLSRIGQARAGPMAAVLSAVLAVMFKITNWIVALTPLAVFGVIAWLAATQGLATVMTLAKLVVVMYLGYASFALLCIAGFSLTAERPLWVAKRMAGPALIGFVTRSSEVALPLHIERLEEIGVPNRIVSVVLPLGYSFNLDGSAVYISLATTFIAEAYGIHLSFPQLLTVLGTGLIASKGVANVPSGSLVALSTVLLALGLPAESVALIAGIDVFLDMGRTGMNVFGNTLSVLVARKLTEAPTSEPVLAPQTDT